jgi:hypothetical protein
MKKEEVKQQELERLQGYADTYRQTLKDLAELEAPLLTWDKKIIDKRFFEQFFTEKNEWRNWTKYSFSKPEYSFSRYNYKIFLNRNHNLELQTREKEEILTAITELRVKLTEWLIENEAKTKTIGKVDEKKMVADILAVYKKHGCPDIWQKVLDKYEVKYPKEN